MRRRDFIAGIAGSAAAWPLSASAQQSPMPVIGFLGTTGPDDFAARVAAFRDGLKETGNIEGQNVVIEYRWAEGNYDRLDALAADLVDRQVTVIAAVGGEPAPLAAKKATSTIPTVFIMGTDPVKLGIVRNINRPEGNITGLNFFQSELGAKRLGLVHQLLPRATVIGVLINPTFSDAEDHADEIKVAARPLGMRVHVAKTHTTDGFDAAFLTLVQQKVDALVLANDALFFSERRKLTTLAAHHAMPAIYPWREFAADGGLMSYSPSILEGYRQVGIYTGKVLKGAKPRDLPILQPTKFQFVINLKTAKALGIEIPPILLAQADEVIE